VETEFTQFGGCGNALFWATNADDTVAITVLVEVGERNAGQPFDATYDLARDDGVEVRYIEGAALSNGMCNDVANSGYQEERSEALGVGTLAVHLDPASADPGGFSSGGAELSDARLSDGRVLARVEFETDEIGLFPG